MDKHERYGAEEGEEESDHRLGCDVLVLSRISSNSPNVHNPLTSGIQFGIFRYPGKMHLKRIEMNCPSRYSCTPPRIIPRIASRMTTKYDPRFNVTGGRTGYPTWYRLVARPLRQMTIAEGILANSTIKRQSLIDPPRASSPIQRSKLRYSMIYSTY